MDTILQDLRYAVRTLARMRGVAIVAIITLALGIGATTTMFSVVYAALLRPPPFAEPDRLVMLYVTRTTPRDGLVRLRWSRPVIARLEDLVNPGAGPAGVSSFETIASVYERPAVISQRALRCHSRINVAALAELASASATAIHTTTR